MEARYPLTDPSRYLATSSGFLQLRLVTSLSLALTSPVNFGLGEFLPDLVILSLYRVSSQAVDADLLRASSPLVQFEIHFRHRYVPLRRQVLTTLLNSITLCLPHIEQTAWTLERRLGDFSITCSSAIARIYPIFDLIQSNDWCLPDGAFSAAAAARHADEQYYTGDNDGS